MKIKLPFIILCMFIIACFSANEAGAKINFTIGADLFQPGLTNSDPGVKVFPNPIKNYKFSVSAKKNIQSVKVNNILGQKVEIDFQKKGDRLFEVSLNERKQGIYLVTVIFEDKTKEVKRIVVNQD